MLHELKFDNCSHSRDPLVSCALEGVAAVLAGIEDIAMVIHSPQGCSSTVAGAYDMHEIDFFRRKIACSRLFETDIIMGATDKLRDLIRQADTVFGTRVIFVVGTCAADIIGEDIEAVCRAMQPEVSAKLIPVMAGGFRGDTFDGMNLGLKALLPFIEDGASLPAGAARKHGDAESGHPFAAGSPAVPGVMHTANLLVPQANLNPTWWADYRWVTAVLQRMGVAVNAVVPREIPLDRLRETSSADVNILLSHDAGHDFARRVSAPKMNLILDGLPLPVGIENTGRWLRELGRECHAAGEAERIIREGESKVQDILRKRGLMIIPRYRNCRIAVSADCTIGIPLVRMLFSELEMIPELLLFRSDPPGARTMLERELSDMGIRPATVFAADGWKIRSALAATEVDAVLGSAWEKYMAEERGVRIFFDVIFPVNRDRYIDRQYFGYDGMLNILEAMGNGWETGLRSKRIKWEQFEREPFHENSCVCE